jgi:hypothetical protein
MYAKCIKGHVLKNADDWILCENLPAPDARCWQEGGDTIFSLAARQRIEAEAEKKNETSSQMSEDEAQPEKTTQRATP